MSLSFRAGAGLPADLNGPVHVAFQAFDQAWIDGTIPARFEFIANMHSDRPALVDGVRNMTYGALREQVVHLSRQIAGAVQAGPVGIMLPHDARVPVAALASLTAGRPYVVINGNDPPARIHSLLAQAGTRLVLSTRACCAAATLPPGIHVLMLDEVDRAEGTATGQCVPPSAPAVILYTSGSTGTPKGICNDQQAILHRVADATNAFHIHPGDRIMLLNSGATIAGQREMYSALLNGATLCVCDPKKDGLNAVHRMFREQRVTLCYIVPALLRALFRTPGAQESLASLRGLRIGGDITLASDYELFRSVASPDCHFLCSFSSTEMPSVFQWFVPPDWKPAGLRIPVGYQRPDSDIAVVDEDGNEAAPGEVGELVVRSRYVALGHWQDGALQPGPFVRDEHDPAARIFRSGDMVSSSGDGLWSLAERKDRQVKIMGWRIDTREIEAILRTHPQVSDAAVIVGGTGENDRLVAFVASGEDCDNGGGHDLTAKLAALLGERLPQYMQPARIHILPAIPQLPGFKPDLPALRRHDAAHGRAASRPAAATTCLDVEAKRYPPVPLAVHVAVRDAWTRVMGAQYHERDTCFSDSDGDSLKAVEIWYHIEKALGQPVPFELFHPDARPSELERMVAENMREVTPPPDPENIIHFFPGVLGDDPVQVEFRAGLPGKWHHNVVEYPHWRHAMRTDCSFKTFIDAVLAQMLAGPQPDSYRLIGCSFGGVVAFECARRLLADGRRVDLLVMVDSRRWDRVKMPRYWKRDATNPPRSAAALAFDALVIAMAKNRMFRLLQGTTDWSARHYHRLAFKLETRVAMALRGITLRDWKPQPMDARTLLVLSDDRYPGEPMGYGWQGLCSALTTVRVGGTHASMMRRGEREAVIAHIAAFLAEAGGASSSAPALPRVAAP